MKNISSGNHKPRAKRSNQSPLHRIYARGHKKMAYKKTTGNLIMQMSANDHKRIAMLIAQWLGDDKNTDK